MADSPDIHGVDGRQPLTEAYRLLRRVGPPDAPLAGWLARCTDGRTVLLAEPDVLTELDLLGGAEGAHVLTARDLVRTVDGVGVELDWCVDRLARVLARRAEAQAALTAGETITLAVSIRRGMAEVMVARPARDAEWPRGEWWITDAGRPVFAQSSSGDPADVASRGVLEAVVDACADRRLRALLTRWLDRDDDAALADAAIEPGLFAIAEPSPVRTEVFGPVRSRNLPATAPRREPAPEPPPRRGLLSAMERHIDTDLAGMTSDAVHRVLRRLRGRMRPRPWLLAGAAAAAVLVAGALWPTGEGAPAQAEQPPMPGRSASTPAATPVDPPAEQATAVTDLEAIAGELLDARIACRDAPECLAALVEDPDRDFDRGPIDAPSAQRTIALLDDFGGVAVLRVEDTQTPAAAQLIVIGEADGRWRLRDVHDVAQPGA